MYEIVILTINNQLKDHFSMENSNADNHTIIKPETSL
jgi:hypothetical protein